MIPDLEAGMLRGNALPETVMVQLNWAPGLLPATARLLVPPD